MSKDITVNGSPVEEYLQQLREQEREADVKTLTRETFTPKFSPYRKRTTPMPSGIETDGAVTIYSKGEVSMENLKRLLAEYEHITTKVYACLLKTQVPISWFQIANLVYGPTCTDTNMKHIATVISRFKRVYVDCLKTVIEGTGRKRVRFYIWNNEACPHKPTPKEAGIAIVDYNKKRKSAMAQTVDKNIHPKPPVHTTTTNTAPDKDNVMLQLRECVKELSNLGFCVKVMIELAD